MLGRLESGIPQMKATYKGFIVDLQGSPQKPFSHRGASFRLLTARDFEAVTVFRSSLAAEPSCPTGRRATPSSPWLRR